MKKTLPAMAALAATALIAFPAFAGNLVVDGDFANSLGDWTNFVTGQTLPTAHNAWTVTSGNVDIINTYWTNPMPGQGSVDLDGYNPGAISQTLQTVAGQKYLLSFSLSGNPYDNPLKVLGVYLNDTLAAPTYTVDVSHSSQGNMNWATETIAFQAGSDSTKLTFASLDSNQNSYWGPAVGNVSVSAVPLPAALPMFGAALVGLGGLARRRAKKSA